MTIGNRLLVLPYGATHNEEGKIVFDKQKENEDKKIVIPDTVENDPTKKKNKFVVQKVGNGEQVQKLDPVPKKGDVVFVANARVSREKLGLPVIDLDDGEYLILTPDQIVELKCK